MILDREQTNKAIIELKANPDRKVILDEMFSTYPKGFKAVRFGDFVITRNYHGVTGDVSYAFYSAQSWERMKQFALKYRNDYVEPEVGEIFEDPQLPLF